jgi:hypothetical protein
MGMNFCDLYALKPSDEVKHVIDSLYDAMCKNIPRFPDGTFHRETTMWSDDTFMSMPFLSRLGKLTGDKKYFDECICQINGFFKRLFMEDEKLISHISAKEVFFDVNFRGSFYTRELVNSLLKETTILKISDEEISFFGGSDHITTLLSISKSNPKLKYICLTLDKDGALVFDCRNKSILYSDKPKGKVVSTVGAGDSFAACFLSSLLSGFKIEKCLDRAVILSDFVVTQLGAVPDYDPAELFA